VKRAAVYLRVSSDNGRQTTENQRDEVVQLARARGYEPVVFEEMESAMKARPVLDRMLADVRAGRVEAVAIWSMDRLGRGFACFDLFRELSRLGVRILSVREPWTDVDGPARELLAAVMAWVSGFERQRLIERVHAGLERARKQGKALGRPRTSIVLLRAAAELVEGGTPVAAAARAKGISRASLYRYLSENPTAAAKGNTPALAG
jgi:DNA invertase Pin-like site-specific DNA recombinase